MKKVLRFLNLLDRAGRLSLTNIAVYVAIYKLATTQGTSINDVAMSLLALANYAHKRYAESKALEVLKK